MGKIKTKSVIESFAIFMLLLTSSWPAVAQQKVQFTQYMFNGLVINPAYAGADEALSLTLVQRSQWTGVDSAPTTQTLAAHTLFAKKHVGLGITIVNDKIGVHKNLTALTNYAYHIQTGEKSYLSFGLQAGIHNQKSDYASLAGGANNDPKIANAYLSNTFLDFGMGVYFRSPKLIVGLSAPELIPEHITLNDSVRIRLSKVNFLMFTKYSIAINDHLNLEPSVLMKYLSGVPLSFDLNMNLVYRKVLTMGLSYRKKESVDFLLKAQITAQLQFGYSYDHPVGIISNLSNGSHELMVNYLFKYVQRNVSSPR
jgi:type IX secretion system PorP/SprF family membrane protein